MRTVQQTWRGITAAGLIGMLVACSGVNGTTGPNASADAAAGGTGDGAPPTGAGAGFVRVRCELRVGRSKISVDGNNLRPLGGTFRATAQSGANVATSPFARAVGDEAEFDFDSDPGDIREGATPIPASFITGGSVIGRILDAQGNEVARGEAQCEVR